ncbi:hypothetical protein JAAARDRAFT_191247 [Jaapia argillacea MUCL 33604]|uniref:non-specific serine/threonine protein kinase n=1 Tax=Jaapia argillacea MUCL 33604 TaxID=933084 RepID=A0A067QCA9_9AGAM|nr:hypothetical protein JAAARDRAFT_191247 [Jaapia argillacea MUCL 33604]
MYTLPSSSGSLPPESTLSTRQDARTDDPKHSPRANERTVDLRPRPLTLADLTCHLGIGEGAYGAVVLLRVDRDPEHEMDLPGALIAAKYTTKRTIRQLDRTDPHATKYERSMLARLPWHPFVAGLISAFHDSRNIYLGMELIPSGTLAGHIQKNGPLDNSTSRFYFANIACGLDFIHRHGIIHRDLKPDNVLIGSDGYLCLADFGQAKLASENDNDWLNRGTPGYMAPELIHVEEKSYYTDHTADWWASGCCLFEMLTKRIAFIGRQMLKIHRRTIKGRYRWRPEDDWVEPGAKDIVSRLLTPNSDLRLGCKGTKEVQAHPWLESIDWTQLERRLVLPPYIPPEPSLDEKWHRRPLPRKDVDQDDVPDLEVELPPLEQLYNDQFVNLDP